MRLVIPEDVTPWPLLEPAADAAGRTSAYHSLKGAVRAWVVFYMNQANAATVACSVLQASAVAGTGSKAVAAGRIWTKLDEAFALYTKQTEAASFTTDAATKKKVVILEIDPTKMLDVAGGFDCIAAVTGASNVANITSAFLVIQNTHHGIPTVSPLTD
jgi:hypothetical protein